MPQTGIEPVRCRHHRILSPARLPVPPLRHLRYRLLHGHTCKHCSVALINAKWMEVDSNHRSNLQQIYSLSPLATRESIHARQFKLILNCPDNINLYHSFLSIARNFFTLFATRLCPSSSILLLTYYLCALHY